MRNIKSLFIVLLLSATIGSVKSFSACGQYYDCWFDYSAGICNFTGSGGTCILVKKPDQNWVCPPCQGESD